MMGAIRPWGKLVVCAFLLSLCAGCFRIESLIKLDDDGSGKLFVRCLLSAKIAGKQKLESKAEEMAAKLGEGVKFVDSKTVELKGWKGIQAEYHFTDINKLKIGAEAFEMNDSEASSATADKSPELDLAFLSGKKDGPWRFKYTPGSVNKLVAYHEQPKSVTTVEEDPFAAAGVELSNAPAAPALDLSSAFAISFLRPMFNEARASLTVQVDGEIVETNAPKQPKSNSVQLFHLDLTKFAESKEFDKAIMGTWSLDRLVTEKVAGIAALKSDQKVTVRFR